KERIGTHMFIICSHPPRVSKTRSPRIRTFVEEIAIPAPYRSKLRQERCHLSDIDDIPVCQVAAIADASACPAPVVQLFYNPASGSFRADRLLLLERALEAAGARVIRAISCVTADPLAIAPDASHVCIAGGDGTVRHVAAL